MPNAYYQAGSLPPSDARRFLRLRAPPSFLPASRVRASRSALAVNEALRYTDAIRKSTGVTMSTDVAEIETKIRSLSLEDKTELIRALIAELDGPADGDVERAWLQEAQRRYREVVEGNVRPVAGERVFENLRAHLKR